MSAPTAKRFVDRLQLAAITGLLVGSLTFLVYSALLSPRTAFVAPGGTGAWITYPMAPSSDAIGVDLTRVPVFTFSRRFRVESEPAALHIVGRALRESSLEINGRPVVVDQPHEAEGAHDWKRGFEVSGTDLLRDGMNEIRVQVEHPLGPALLQLSLEAGDLRLVTDPSWSVSLGAGPALDAVIADDTQLNAEALAMPTPAQIAADRAGTLFLLFAGSIALYALTRRLPSERRAHAPKLVLALATLYWLALFASKMTQLPVLMGFDIPAHLNYIDYLLEHRRLPLATDGWSTYHPPLFYLLTSALVSLAQVERESMAGQVVYRLIPFAAGLGNVWITYFVARRLFGGEPLRCSLAVAVAALLPMNVYMSAYVSNEQLHGAWVSLAILISCGLLMQPGVTRARLAALCLTLGLAVLTKFTSVLIVPVVAIFVALKVWLADRRPLASSLAMGGAVLLGVALVGGWFYLRNWIHFGTPLVGNWAVPGDLSWWEQPGFHSLGYYTQFGVALRHPFFAGYASFWDGIYSTLWGDGLAAGMVRLATRHPQWNYDYMTLAYGLALPATLLLFVGVARTLRMAYRDSDLGRRLAFSLVTSVLYVVGFALLAITISLPYYAQAKAFYAIATLVPIALVSAVGLAWIPEALQGSRFAPLTALYFGWLGSLGAVLVLAFLG